MRIAPVKTIGFSLDSRARDEIRRFLERVGSVRDHHARDFRTREMLDDAIPQRPHPLDRHVRAGKLAPFLGLDCRDRADSFRGVLGSRPASGPAERLRRRVVAHGDRAAGEEDYYHLQSSNCN